MVIERNSNKNPLAKASAEALEIFGRSDFELTRRVSELDSNDRVISFTESSRTLSGDLQYVSFNDREILASGIAKVGNGIFYTKASEDIKIEDIIEVRGARWELNNQVEAEDVGAEEIYQAWVCVRLPNDVN